MNSLDILFLVILVAALIGIVGEWLKELLKSFKR